MLADIAAFGFPYQAAGVAMPRKFMRKRIAGVHPLCQAYVEAVHRWRD